MKLFTPQRYKELRSSSFFSSHSRNCLDSLFASARERERERERERNKKEMRKRENEEELGRRKKSLFPQPCLMSTKLVARMCEEEKISSGSEWELGQAEN